jgi:dephospho-CoA kinase
MFCATPSALDDYMDKKAVEGGNITRTVLCQLEDQIGSDGAMFKPYTDEQLQSIHTMLDRLMADTYTPEGMLNKAAVAKFLLASPSNAKAIDAIVHPAVFNAFRQSRLEFMESAILFESGADALVDKVIAVIAPKKVRLQRVMKRDGISREQALQWMNRQLPQQQVICKSDYILINDGEANIDNQINKILRQCNKQF